MIRSQKIGEFISRNYISIIILVLFLLYFFLLHANSFNSPWERDEGEYAYSAWLMEQGQTPYLQSFIQKPPLIIYTYYLAHLIEPLALWPPRLLSFLFTLASCVLLGLMAKRLYGAPGGWLALWISPLLLTSPFICALAANTEKFMLLPLIGLLALFVFRRGQETKWTYFWAGILAALAVLYKPIALLPAILLIIYWLASNWWMKKQARELFFALAVVVLGVVSVTLLSVIYFIINGALGELWQQVIVYNFNYAADMKSYFPSQFFRYLQIFWNNWWIIFLIIITSLIFRPKLFGLWWSLLLVSLLSIISTPMGHYYLLIMPFLILLAAGAYVQLASLLRIKELEWRNTLLVAVIIIIISISFCSIYEQFFLSPRGLSIWIYGQEDPFVESELMADKIRQNTQIGDGIFVGGSESQLYYFSQREAVSKFNITYPLLIDTPWRTAYQQQAINDIEQNKPVAIILSQGRTSGLWEETEYFFADYLLDKLKNDYYLVGATALTAQGELIWLEADNISDQAYSNLLLYLRK